MVPQEKIDLVRRLLAEGRTYREITTETGVSRGTIGAVARGERREYVDLPFLESPNRGPVVRCPGCGGRVYAPCVLCRVRKLKADDRAERRRMADRIESTDRRNNPKAPEGGTLRR